MQNRLFNTKLVVNSDLPVEVYGLFQNRENVSLMLGHENMEVTVDTRYWDLVFFHDTSHRRSYTRSPSFSEAGVADVVLPFEELSRETSPALLTLGQIIADIAISSCTRKTAVLASIHICKQKNNDDDALTTAPYKA